MGMDNQWTCQCGQVNNKNFCIECGGSKETHKMQPVAADAGWTCKCGHSNAATSSFCSQCGTAKTQVSAEVVPVETMSVEVVPTEAVAVGTWCCSCGKSNQPEDRYCSECGSLQPGEAEKHWFCLKCGARNEADYCFSCGTSRSGETVAERNQKKAQQAAEAEARRKVEEERRQAEEEAARRAEEERRQAEAEAQRRAEEERRQAEAEAKRSNAEERRQAEVAAPKVAVEETAPQKPVKAASGEPSKKIKFVILGIVAVILVGLIGFALMPGKDVETTGGSSNGGSTLTSSSGGSGSGKTEENLQAEYQKALADKNDKHMQDANERGKVVFVPERVEKLNDNTLKMTGYFYNGKGVVKKIEQVMVDITLLNEKKTTATATGIVCDINGLENISLGQGERTNSVTFELPINTANASFDHFDVTSSKVKAVR